jgi:valyl-tRNA synthetase
VIDTPPPTVSGTLHMGHMFSYTQADFIARFNRMQGKNVFYPIGFDDNGLPTEKLVEKTKKIRGASMDRQEFVEICREVVKKVEQEYREVINSAALSVDWDQEYQTISSQSIKLSQMSFLDLMQKDQAYRDFQPTLWDPVDRTALAQADIVDQEKDSVMHYIKFTAENGDDLEIATTRPELLPACGALLVHPEDDRYQHLIGKKAFSPLFKVQVNIIADDQVQMEKGSGMVMCCTFGDTTDILWWRKHHLPLRQIIKKDGKISLEELDYISHIDRALYQELHGLKISEAREKIVKLLGEHGKLIKSENITHTVKCAERSGSPLEILVTAQWSIKILDNKQKFLEKAKECNWYPSHMRTRLEHWIAGLNWDWCISRQRFFGVPFPVWYSKRAGEEGKILLADIEQLPVDPLADLPKGYSREEVEADKDVMDTWATSSISPQLNSLAINDKFNIDFDRHQQLFPADLRPQAHEIIRTWSFYTIVKACLHENKIPWKNLMISGWCLAADKTKMSKSKGNVVNPINLFADKGADVVRYWSACSKLGADIAYSEQMFAIGKKLVNKLWNAAKFCQQYFIEMNGFEVETLQQAIEKNYIFEYVDLWMLDKLEQTLEKVQIEFARYEYSTAKTIAEDFFWNIFCDNYLEIVKVRAYNPNDNNLPGKISAIYSLYFALEVILKLFAPILPYVTEEIYQALYPNKLNSIHQKASWPRLSKVKNDAEIVKASEYLVEISNFVRKFKSEAKLSLKTPINSLYIASKDDELQTLLKKVSNDFHNVTQVENLLFVSLDEIEKGEASQDGKFIMKIKI